FFTRSSFAQLLRHNIPFLLPATHVIYKIRRLNFVRARVQVSSLDGMFQRPTFTNAMALASSYAVL
ncbi:hypothetical protein N9452_05980, partial [Alphaproteobacteria bacterium]|nr:hypothetical protein [Alphaproteobacteria bacterium]